MRPDFSHSYVWTAFQVLLVKRDVPDSPLEQPPFSREPTGLSSRNDRSYAFNDDSVWSEDRLRNEDYK